MQKPSRPSPLRWGILGTSKFAREKVIPAMAHCTHARVAAIASRDIERARAGAAQFGIANAHGSYDELLDDPSIDAVYIPLPNHLHVALAERAAARGKHVLCEKPLALTAAEAARLVVARDRYDVRIQEAFMIRSHPQWTTAIDIVRDGRLGDVRAIVGYFSYHNVDPANIRNVAEAGGGGLADIGCYLVHAARWILGTEPLRVIARIDDDPRFGVDRLVTMLLDFGDAQVTALCSTQLAPSQRIHVFGTRARLEIEIPFNAPPDRPCRLFIEDAHEREVIEVAACDQYTLQADAFSRAILDGTPQLLPLEDSVANMRVLDALRESARSLGWVRVPL